jgi:alkylhydroperoxidase/carboxymuconolactone decarboxylase family protein YurZ
MTNEDQLHPDPEAPDARLPGAARHMAVEYPQPFNNSARKASRAGPLDARTSRLIHLALAIAAGSEGAAHSHARRALAEGISLEELEHIPVLAITTIGWSQAIKGMTWVRDITRRRL